MKKLSLEKKIILVSYGGGHVTMLAPVARELKAKGYEIFFLALTTAGFYLDQLGIENYGYRHFSWAFNDKAQLYGDLLAKDIDQSPLIPKEESIAYLGLNYQDLVEQYGEEGAKEQYALKGRQAFLPISLFEKWFSRFKPDLVIATNSPRSERAAIIASRNLDIPCICLIDFLGLQEVEWVGKPGYADRLCVLNESIREFFIKKGRRKEEVLVTGNPAFQNLNSPLTLQKSYILQKEKGWLDTKINILWASQVEPEKHPFTHRRGDTSLPEKIERQLRSFIAHQENYRLVIRYHPSENKIFKNGQERVYFSFPTEELDVLLHAMDIVVVTASTVGLQAYLAGCSVVSVDSSIFFQDVPYSKMGISKGVLSLDDLQKALKKVTIPKRIFLRTENHCLEEIDNKMPTHNIIKVIESVLI